MTQNATQTLVDPQIIEGVELALAHIVDYGSKLGYSVSAYPGERRGASNAAYELFVKLQELKGVPLDSPEGEAAYIAYMRSWRG